MVHYGFLHKWLPKVQEYLVANREDGRCTPITHVWYLEADAVMDMSATELLGMINQMPQKHNIAWPGWTLPLPSRDLRQSVADGMG